MGSEWAAMRPSLTLGHSKNDMDIAKTHATASTDPHRTDRIIDNAYMRYVLTTSYGMRVGFPQTFYITRAEETTL
uniref:SFRICE_029840 n=1 Tax=Spodoptera frugiperda TaxID=7108 RepID=A0A2H1WGY0_SPOFR